MQIVTKLKKYNFHKTNKNNCQKTKKVKLWQNSVYDESLTESFSKNNLTPWQPMRCTLGSALRSCDVWWRFSFGDVLGLFTFQLLVKFQFWWRFRFVYI